MAERENKLTGKDTGNGLLLLMLAAMGGVFVMGGGLSEAGKGSPDGSPQYASNGAYIGWLWNTYSTDGTAAYSFHHSAIPNPPHGNTPAGLENIHIAPYDPNHPHVFGDPTMSPDAFLQWSQHAGSNGQASPIYTDGVAMDVYYKLYLDGVDPRAWAAITMAEDHAGTDPGWYAAGTGNYINELYNPHILNNHQPGFRDYVSHRYHYMDFSPFGNEKSTVGVGYADALFAYYYDHGYNNPAALEKLLAGGSQSAANNTTYWLNHLPAK